jgi:hypothetical protein
VSGTGRFIGYPVDRMLAAFRDAAGAAEAATAIRGLGIADRDITVLRGDEGANRLDGSGAANGVAARVRRILDFTMMDQLVDFAHYEQAVRAGGAVVMVKVRGDAHKSAVAAALQASGGHFLNYYGRFATEEISRWQGSEPAINELMRR